MAKNDTPIGKLGRYQVYEEIGRGGFSVVYRAENPALKKPIAIKLMLPALFQDPQAVEQFIREARSAAALTHDHIVRVYDLEEDQGRLFMALEYLPGGDLHRWLEAHGRLSFRQAAALIGQVAEALDYAHEQGLVHGDVKPGNILLGEDGAAKLTDFGVLRAVESSGVTSAEMTRGTPYYIAPEQAEGGRATPKSDQYSLGVVAYELFTGRVPFEGETPLAIYLKHLREAPPPAGQLNPLVTPQLQAALHKALEKAPDNRYPDCRAFARALREAVAATEAEQYQLLVRQAQAELAAHDADSARPLIEKALQIMPDDPPARALLADLQAQERAQRSYQAAAEALASSRQGAEKLAAEKGRLPDPQGLLPRLAPPPSPPWKAFLARWRIATYLAAGLLLAGVVFSLAYTGYVEIGSRQKLPAASTQKAALVTLVRSPTATFTSTPSLTPTPTFTLTPTNTFTPTPTLTPTTIAILSHNLNQIELLRTLYANSGVRSVVFSPDGKKLVSGSVDGTIRIWQVSDGMLLMPPLKNSNSENSVAFSPDGKTLASGSYDGVIRLWDITDGKTVFHISNLGYGYIWEPCASKSSRYQIVITSVVFSPDGKILASGTNAGEIRLWNVATGEEFVPIRYNSYYEYWDPNLNCNQVNINFVNSVAFSPNGRILASGMQDSTIWFYDMENGSPPRQLVGGRVSVQSIVFSSDGSLLASGHSDGTVKLWDVSSRQLVNTLGERSGSSVFSVAFSPKNNLLASGGTDDTIKIWDLVSRQLIRTLKEHSTWVFNVAFSPDGLLLISADRNGNIFFWGIPQWQLRSFYTPTPTTTP